jgi:hypothetical protein
MLKLFSERQIAFVEKAEDIWQPLAMTGPIVFD